MQNPDIDGETEDVFTTRMLRLNGKSEHIMFSIDAITMFDQLPDNNNFKNLFKYSTFPTLEEIALKKIALSVFLHFRGDRVLTKPFPIKDNFIYAWITQNYNLIKLPKNITCKNINLWMNCIDYELHKWQIQIQWINNLNKLKTSDVAWSPYCKINEIETFLNIEKFLEDDDAFIYATKLCLKEYLLEVPSPVRKEFKRKYSYLDSILFWTKYCSVTLNEREDSPVPMSYKRIPPNLKRLLSEAINMELIPAVKYIWNVFVEINGINEAFMYVIGHNFVANEDICAFFLMNFTELQQKRIFHYYNRHAILRSLCKLWPYQNVLFAMLDKLILWKIISSTDFIQLLNFVGFETSSTVYPLNENCYDLLKILWDLFSDRLIDNSPAVLNDLTSFLYRAFHCKNEQVLFIITRSRTYAKIKTDLIFGKAAKQKYFMILFKPQHKVNDFLDSLCCTKSEIKAIWAMYQDEFYHLQTYNNNPRNRFFPRIDCVIM